MPAPVAVAWDGEGTEMVNFHPAATALSSKPQAWMTQQPTAASASHDTTAAASATFIGQAAPSSASSLVSARLRLAAHSAVASQTIIPVSHTSPASSVPAATASTVLSSSSASASSPPIRSVSFRLSSSRRSSRRPSANLSASSALSLSSPSKDARSLQCDTLDGYTVIDIRSLPPSLTTSPAHSAAASPAPAYRVNALHVDTARLMQAAQEEDVSPRTALFLAMKQKAKAEKKKAKKAKEKSEREKEKEKDKQHSAAANNSSGSGGSTSRQQQQDGAAARQPHSRTLQPYSSASVSSSLHSLSLSPELSSLSASLSRSPRSSLSRSSMDDERRDERRLKKDERRRLGYKLCKVSGCMEARGKDESGHQHKYCSAHLGIHTLNNPNTRKKSQRDIT